jgi:myo-inositol 2-dehydrogenase/D-chiro-inositol 1-dehydrogenase
VRETARPRHWPCRDCRKALAGVDARIQFGFNRRYDRSHRSVAEAIQNGGIGNLELLIVTSRDPSLSSLAYLKVSGGIFRDMTIHDFDLARFVLAGDEIVEVSAMVDQAVAELGDVDTAMVTMKASSGTLIHINNSRRSVYGYDQRLEAFGSKGMARSENLRSTTLLRSDEKGTDIKQPLLNFFIERYTQAYLEELNEFIGVVKNQKQPQVGFEDGRRALILANAAWDSLRSGKVIRPSYA